MSSDQNIFEKIISPDNLFTAWDAFKKGKMHKRDVQYFSWHLEQNIFTLHRDLATQRFRHGPYMSFHIRDPKQRHIHKATVRDRIVHHAVCNILNPIFEPTFTSHSFSCRVGKGTHKGVETLNSMLRKVSRNSTRPCFALKCDVHRFFDSIDHDILLSLIAKKVQDARVLDLIENIVESYSSGATTRERE